MMNCEPYNEVSKETLNPHYLLQQGNASFDDEEYKKPLFSFTNKMSYMTANKQHYFLRLKFLYWFAKYKVIIYYHSAILF